jgi:hypothetical protein
MAAQQAKKAYPLKPSAVLSIDELAQLLAKVASGSASVEERDLARRSLGTYRNKYRSGALSPRAALRLGLLDAKGNFAGP